RQRDSSSSARRLSSSTSPTATSRPSCARVRPRSSPQKSKARSSRSRRPSQARRHDRPKGMALSLVNAQARMIPNAAVKVAVVDDSCDIVPPAQAATTVTAERWPPSRPDAGDEARSEWIAGLTLSAARWVVRLSALLAGLVCWHYASSKGLTLYVRFEQIPGPLQVGEALINQLQHVAFYLHIGASLRRIAISYSLAAGIGITLGLLMGRSRFIRDLIFPYVEILRPIPGVAWIPLAILLWPTEEGSIIYITFLGALFPIILNTVHGVEQTPEV